jgi:hypothetical protein
MYFYGYIYVLLFLYMFYSVSSVIVRAKKWGYLLLADHPYWTLYELYCLKAYFFLCE